MSRLRPLLLLILAGMTISLSGCHSDSGAPPQSTAPTATPTRIQFASIGSRGIFDPSLTQDAGTGRLWMSYSAVNPSVMWPTQNLNVVTTRLAFSDNGGTSWVEAGTTINNALDVTIPLAPPNNAGTWHHEVSKLVYDHDPAAPVNARWRLFWHHYLIVNDQRLFEHGWIGYKEASTPTGLAGATERKLFGALGYDAANNMQGGTTGSPVGGAPLIAFHTAFHQDLSGCAVLSEPGVVATASGLYLSILCGEAAPALNHRIVLMRCANPCDPTQATNWAYVRTIFQDVDAVAVGALNFSATDLFESGGKIYLMISPATNTPIPDAYNGCFVYEFSDIVTGTLTGGGTGITQIAGTPGSFNGACAYHAGATTAGFLYGEVLLTAPDLFRIFMSGRTL